MPEPARPAALPALNQATRAKSSYPEPFASQMAGRIKRTLGDLFGLTNFGVNITVLLPGAVSALLHAHSRQDEFIYVLEGAPTLVTESEQVQLEPGMCAGFKAGTQAHRLVNGSQANVVYLEIGDRTAGDEITYPADDLMAQLVAGKWVFFHKDGSPY